MLDYPAIAIGFYETGGYDVMIESHFKATASNMNYVQRILPPIYSSYFTMISEHAHFILNYYDTIHFLFLIAYLIYNYLTNESEKSSTKAHGQEDDHPINVFKFEYELRFLPEVRFLHISMG